MIFAWNSSSQPPTDSILKALPPAQRDEQTLVKVLRKRGIGALAFERPEESEGFFGPLNLQSRVVQFGTPEEPFFPALRDDCKLLKAALDGCTATIDLGDENLPLGIVKGIKTKTLLSKDLLEKECVYEVIVAESPYIGLINFDDHDPTGLCKFAKAKFISR